MSRMAYIGAAADGGVSGVPAMGTATGSRVRVNILLE